MTKTFLEGLNEAQRAAVEQTEGPVLIIAGPGSGKTRVISHRIAHLVSDLDVFPYRVLAVTFTNKAAREMRERVVGLLGERGQDVALGTFHALCARWLRQDGAAAGVGRGFTIYDDGDQISLIKQVLKRLNLNEKQNPPRAVLSLISRAKSEMLSPAAYKGRIQSYPEEIASRVYPLYQEALEAAGALDFDDGIDLLEQRTDPVVEQPAEVLREGGERLQLGGHAGDDGEGVVRFDASHHSGGPTEIRRAGRDDSANASRGRCCTRRGAA